MDITYEFINLDLSDEFGEAIADSAGILVNRDANVDNVTLIDGADNGSWIEITPSGATPIGDDGFVY